MLNFFTGSFPLTLLISSFFAGLIIGYLFFYKSNRKLKRRVLDLEEDLLKYDAKQLFQEARESKRVLREMPPLK